jgi:hypothetical protein
MSSKHYDFTRQADVVTNFRIGAIFPPAPIIIEGCDELTLLLPELWEGILMVYLGTYHVSYYSPSSDNIAFHTASSYELVGRMRLNLSVPDLHSSTSNIAWPILQAKARVDPGTSEAARLLKAELDLEEQDDDHFMATLEGIQSKTLISSWQLDRLLAQGGAVNPYYEPTKEDRTKRLRREDREDRDRYQLEQRELSERINRERREEQERQWREWLELPERIDRERREEQERRLREWFELQERKEREEREEQERTEREKREKRELWREVYEKLGLGEREKLELQERIEREKLEVRERGKLELQERIEREGNRKRYLDSNSVGFNEPPHKRQK